MFASQTRILTSAMVTVALCGLVWSTSSPTAAQQFGVDNLLDRVNSAEDDGLGYVELTRGPVHEAFAEQISLEPSAGVIVSSAPPQTIEEIPPENRPADENAIWIGGYWQFDDVQEDFIWISGVWRVPPVDSNWVPGYWAELDDGYQWIGGFWIGSDREEVAYFPAPPETLEQGPTSAAPSDEHFWIPGCWYYRDRDYVWRPGHWAAGSADYVWVPDYYRWTPRGYVLCGGYWDYPLWSRGYLFAPVHFTTTVYTQPAYRYRPRVVLDLGPLHLHLFVRPTYSHYYFGDYYDTGYTNRGYVAWSTYSVRRQVYDPLFVYNVNRYRSRGIDFGERMTRWHSWFSEHEKYRPRHTYREQREFRRTHQDANFISAVSLGESYDAVVSERRNDFVARDERRRGDDDATRDRYRRLRQQRQEMEVADRGDARAGRPEPGRQPGEQDAERDRKPEERDLPRFVLRDRTEGRSAAEDRDRDRPGRDVTGRPGARPPRDGDLSERLGDEARDRPGGARDEVPRGRPDADLPSAGDSPRRDPRVAPRDNFPPGRERPDRPRTDRPSTDRPSTDRPSTDRPSTDRPTIDRPPVRGDADGPTGAGSAPGRTERPDVDSPSGRTATPRPDRRPDGIGVDRPRPDAVRDGSATDRPRPGAVRRPGGDPLERRPTPDAAGDGRGGDSPRGLPRRPEPFDPAARGRDRTDATTPDARQAPGPADRSGPRATPPGRGESGDRAPDVRGRTGGDPRGAGRFGSLRDIPDVPDGARTPSGQAAPSSRRGDSAADRAPTRGPGNSGDRGPIRGGSDRGRAKPQEAPKRDAADRPGKSGADKTPPKEDKDD